MAGAASGACAGTRAYFLCMSATRHVVMRFGCAAICALVTAGCATGWPSQRPYAVLHVLANDCSPDHTRTPLLITAQQAGGEILPERSIAMEYLQMCGREEGELFTQVWRSPVRIERSSEFSVHIGTRLVHGARYVSPPNTRMRIDHIHVWLGVVALMEDGHGFLLPQGTGMSPVLADRQGCEKRTSSHVAGQDDQGQRGCGIEWRRADLLTFEPVEDGSNRK